MYYKIKFQCKSLYTQEQAKALNEKAKELAKGDLETVEQFELYDKAACARYFEPYEYVRHIEVANKKQLDQEIQKILNADEISQLTEIHEVLEVEKVTVKEFVEKEVEFLYSQLAYRYIKYQLKPKKMTAEKYEELKNKYLKDDKCFLEMLKYLNKSIMIENDLRSMVNKVKNDNSPVKQFYDIVNSQIESGETYYNL